jgi:hypothetical protein
MDNFMLGWLPTLFADQQAIRNVIRGVHHRQAEIDTNGLASALLFFCLFFVTVWGIARLFLKPDHGGVKNSFTALFRELCRAHQLELEDWWFLFRLARYHRLANPALLFVQPHYLDPAVCGEAWHGQKRRLRELQLKLFAGLASPYPAERPAAPECLPPADPSVGTGADF